MPRPKVVISLSNGNLGLQGPSDNGTSVVLVASPVAPVAGYGVPFLIKTIAQAKAAFVQAGNEAVVSAFVNGFFAEAPEGTKVYVLAMSQVTTLQTLVAAINAEKALNGIPGATSVAETKAAGTLTFTGILSTGNVQNIDAPETGGARRLVSYAQQAGDTTAALLATSIKNAINAGTSGYTAAVAGAVITITAAAGTGSSLNGLQLICSGPNGFPAISQTPFANGVDAVTAAAGFPANGAVRLLAAIKFPSNSYVPTITNGFDQDVHYAVTDAQTLANTWFGKKKPFRFIIEGFGFTNATAAKDYSTATNRNGCIVAGNIDGSTATAALLLLGRAARVQPQENAGKIKTGSLNIAETSVLKIGSVVVDSVPDADLETLWTKRYISFEKNAIASGYVFSDDTSLTMPTDDYNNLRYGRVIDNATRIAFATYYEQLKEDVDVDDNGRLSAAVEKALETSVETNIDAQMRAQLSKKSDGSADVICLVNPDAVTYAALYSANGIDTPNFNILQTGQVYLFVMPRPKGSLQYLNVFLGFAG